MSIINSWRDSDPFRLNVSLILIVIVLTYEGYHSLTKTYTEFGDMDTELYKIIVANARLLRLHIDIFERMAETYELTDLQAQALDESKRIFNNQLSQLQNYRDDNKHIDIGDFEL
jgi:hypothetical protein